MANSLLLQEGIGIGYARRLEIVDQTDTNFFGPMEHGDMPNPYSPELFYLLTKDFTDRLLPELQSPDNEIDLSVHSGEFSRDLHLDHRFTFLRRAARHGFVLDTDELEPVAELLSVRAALLAPATMRTETSKQFSLRLATNGETVNLDLTGERVAEITLGVATTAYDTFSSTIPIQKAV